MENKMSKKFARSMGTTAILVTAVFGTSAVHSVKDVFLEMEKEDIKSLGIPRRLVVKNGGYDTNNVLKHNYDYSSLSVRFGVNNRFAWDNNEVVGIMFEKEEPQIMGGSPILKKTTVYGDLPFEVRATQDVSIRIGKNLRGDTLVFSLE